MKKVLKQVLFESRIGGWLLGLLERVIGLAVVDVDQVAEQRSGWLTPKGKRLG